MFGGCPAAVPHRAPRSLTRYLRGSSARLHFTFISPINAFEQARGGALGAGGGRVGFAGGGLAVESAAGFGRLPTGVVAMLSFVVSRPRIRSSCALVVGWMVVRFVCSVCL
jgi:hypothetical protein